MANKSSKVKKYKNPLNLNIGMIIFSVVFIYVIICIVMYFQKSHIVRYEVKEGSLATNNIYRGVVIRDETVVNTEVAGYVNYYAREGEKVAKNNLVYIIDETGQLSEAVADSSLGENTLSERELAEFRGEIVNFMHGFDSNNFDATYDFKYSLKNTVLKLANVNMLQNLNESGSQTGIANIVKMCNAPIPGIVAYWFDGYEGLTAEAVTEVVFNEKEYEKKQMLGNELVAVGDAVYKLSTDENWSIVIPIEAERGAELEKEGYVKVRFLKNQYESWGATKLLNNSDGKTYLQLTFTNSMVTFVSDRFLDIELIVNDETGLKIPNSSIVEKEFFLVDEDFVTEGDNGKERVIRQCYTEEGNIDTEVIETDVYSYDEDEGVYYVDASILNAGDILHKTDGQETYTVSKRATLIGVYNMNKGYADFKQINILYQNEEYSIVKANTQYGLNVYDYIVLNADSVSADQFINEAKKTDEDK